MSALGHLVRLLAAVSLGFVIIPYAAYRAIRSVDEFMASIVLLGLVLSLPVALGLLFYGKLYWSIVSFIMIWLVYLPAMGIYIAFTAFSILFPGGALILILIAVVGAVLLLVFVRRAGFPLPELPWRRSRGFEETEEFEKGEVREVVEADFEKFKLSEAIEPLDEVECRILVSLLQPESVGLSKKELQEAVGATYKRTLKAVRSSRSLGSSRSGSFRGELREPQSFTWLRLRQWCSGIGRGLWSLLKAG
ncbi:MAG: hypothetical protein FGF50_11535 [Candidatus Brockarchaeota archaeon]|nr:hypothetical protein [Candidatus Brockarchaeota archaeon]